MADTGVVTTVVEDGVLVITLNRPTAKNAIDSAVADGLVHAAEQLDNDGEIRVGVIQGAGGTFCAGMDLKAFTHSGVPRSLRQFYARGVRKPLIAAVEGYALAGGLEIALTCDLIIASTSSRFGIPEVGVGLLAAGGALFRLPRRIPLGAALRLGLTGDSISAQEAFRLGLVTALADPGQALELALEVARRIARNAPLSVVATKELMRGSQGMSEEAGWALQREAADRVFRSSDAREGARAFAEKRSPEWSGV